MDETCRKVMVKMNEWEEIQGLVGPITKEQLKNVDYYVCDGFGVFIPSVGFCGYAITPSHTHPSYSGIIAIHGTSGLFEAELSPNAQQCLSAILPAGIAHEERPQDSFERYYALFISLERMEESCRICGIDSPCKQTWEQFLLPKQVLSWIHLFMKECEENLPESRVLASHWASVIIYELLRYWSKSQGERMERGRRSTKIEDAIQFIQQNFSKEIHVGDIALFVNLSESQLNRLFKREMGETPARYLHHVRLQKAKQLIRAGETSLTQVALDSGFSDSSYFSNCFRDSFGLAPSEFKRMCL